jgi:hypothetical protein
MNNCADGVELRPVGGIRTAGERALPMGGACAKAYGWSPKK